MTDFLNDLNESQLDAVLYNEGPSLVIAGAGSGKTRVLTYKIAHLLTIGYKPYNILALTFTNKAAKEMKERIGKVVGWETASRIWMGTFHSIFSRILRIESDKIGFTPRFTIYDSSDSKSLIKTIIKEMGLDDKTYKPSAIACSISNAKNHLVSADAYMSSRETIAEDIRAKVPLTGEIFRRYVQRCKQADAMDFDDLLFYTYYLLKTHPDVCAKYADGFEYVLVDEYQDTNFAQHCIVWELTKGRQKVCVVGDDAQSIYSFRGANIDNILNFKQQYNGAKVFKLEQNYRSTQNIVGAANSLIHHNNRQIHKEVFSEKEQGELIHLYSAYSDLEEANIVVNKINELRRKYNMEFDEFVILYRTNAQSRTFEEALRKRNMPYRIYGGLSFYQRKEIKDVIAYCRLIINHNDEEAFRRIINYPARGIGQTTLDKISQTAGAFNVSLWEVATAPLNYNLSINKGTQQKLLLFTDLITEFTKDSEQNNAASLIQRIIHESGIMNEITQDKSPENLSRQENLQELLNGANEFVATRREEGLEENTLLSDFLQEISLLTDIDESEGEDIRKINLMTIHSAKGLEYRCVFIVGLEEGLFPNEMAKLSIRELEEERRLFYVALTRSEEFCFLTYAKSRYRYGKMEFSNESRFLSEIDRRFILNEGGSNTHFGVHKSFAGHNRSERSENRSFGNSTSFKSSYTQSQTTRISGLKPLSKIQSTKSSVGNYNENSSSSATSGLTTISNVSVGNIIEHERFGIGKILKVEGNGENTKATVEFKNTGVKQLLLRFARFKVIK